MNENPTPPALHALGGGQAPPDLADDLRRVLRMPAEALQRFWQALGPCVAETLPDELERHLDAFCAAHRLSDDDLAQAIKGCRFLIQSAARIDLPAEQLAEDLDRLCPEAPVIKALLLAGYPQAKAQLRRAIALSAVEAHGRVLVGAQWRVDTIEASERGAKLRAPVAVLTLHYREGTETGRITMQVLPEMIRELEGICEQVLLATRAAAAPPSEGAPHAQ